MINISSIEKVAITIKPNKNTCGFNIGPPEQEYIINAPYKQVNALSRISRT